jgi:hypothetical protein
VLFGQSNPIWWPWCVGVSQVLIPVDGVVQNRTFGLCLARRIGHLVPIWLRDPGPGPGNSEGHSDPHSGDGVVQNRTFGLYLARRIGHLVPVWQSTFWRGASGVQVGDQSEFVNVFRRTLGEAARRVGPLLSEVHFRYLCDRLAASFSPRFYEAVFRCRKISESGSQQLLLDTQAIKGFLLEFPTAGACGGLKVNI